MKKRLVSIATDVYIFVAFCILLSLLYDAVHAIVKSL